MGGGVSSDAVPFTAGSAASAADESRKKSRRFYYRQYRERMKQDPQRYQCYREKQRQYDQKYHAKKRQRKQWWIHSLVPGNVCGNTLLSPVIQRQRQRPYPERKDLHGIDNEQKRQREPWRCFPRRWKFKRLEQEPQYLQWYRDNESVTNERKRKWRGRAGYWEMILSAVTLCSKTVSVAGDCMERRDAERSWRWL